MVKPSKARCMAVMEALRMFSLSISFGEAQATDKSMVVAINPTKGEAAYITDGAPRSAGQEDLTVSPFWAGDEVEVYLAFISENGKDVATSAYCGSVTVI